MNLITTPAQVGYTPAATAIVHSTTASLTSRAPAQPVHLVQYDQTMPVIAVALTANGKPYTVPSGAAVNVRMDKPDGTHVYDPALGVSTDGQTAYIGITAQMTAAAGSSGPIVEIVVNEGVAGTAAFPIIIDPNPVPDSAYESSDEYLTLYEILQQAQSAAQIVQQNAQNLQNVTDNLTAIQNAASNAQAAAASAEAAKTAAQQALGFRTFFGAVSPDENGDLDPSCPMTTPTAASVTVKSKGDRIQSVQVDGFTQQTGSGDPSPTNVREISTAGMRMYKLVLTGTENWVQASSASGADPAFGSNVIQPPASGVNEGSAAKSQFCTDCPIKNAGWYSAACAWVYGTGTSNGIRIRLFGAQSVDQFKSELASRYASGNPVIIWYVPADESQTTGLYIPIQAQGHEYRCQCIPLTAPLCAGGKVESCVPSGCDKTITVDGNTVTVTASGSNYVVTALNAVAGGNVYANSLAHLTLAAGKIVIPGTSFPASVTSAQTANAWLQSNPQKVWYQSTAYIGANDTPVQLETHESRVGILDGIKALFTESVSPSGTYWNLTNGSLPGIKNARVLKCSDFPSSVFVGNANEARVYTTPSLMAPYFSTVDALNEYLVQRNQTGSPVTVEYPLASTSVYAHDPVPLVAVPYTQADVTAANQLAATPSTLPYIDSADVPMLLDSADNADSAAQVMALAANAVPVAGTYVVSSQDGTTLAVSLKAMQDGGDAATLDGMTLEDIKKLISDMIAAAASGT